MRLKSLPSRILLCLLLCLNGSTGLWASTLMALSPDHAHAMSRTRDGSIDCAGSAATHAGDHCAPDTNEDDRGDTRVDKTSAAASKAQANMASPAGSTTDSFAGTGDRAAHHQGGFEDCWCPSPAAGCSCNCVVPTIASSHGVPFAAHHLMTTAAPADPDLPDLPYQTGNIFRPPIG